MGAGRSPIRSRKFARRQQQSPRQNRRDSRTGDISRNPGTKQGRKVPGNAQTTVAAYRTNAPLLPGKVNALTSQVWPLTCASLRTRISLLPHSFSHSSLLFLLSLLLWAGRVPPQRPLFKTRRATAALASLHHLQSFCPRLDSSISIRSDANHPENPHILKILIQTAHCPPPAAEDAVLPRLPA